MTPEQMKELAAQLRIVKHTDEWQNIFHAAADLIESMAQQVPESADNLESWYGHKFKEIRLGLWRCECGKELIEQMAKRAEPVATVHYPRTGGNVGVSWRAIPETGVMPPDGAKLYLAPPSREPLSEQEIWDAVEHGVIGGIGFVSKAVAIARAIEQAHDIRSNK